MVVSEHSRKRRVLGVLCRYHVPTSHGCFAICADDSSAAAHDAGLSFKPRRECKRASMGFMGYNRGGDNVKKRMVHRTEAKRRAARKEKKTPRPPSQSAAKNGSERSGTTNNSQLYSGNNGRYLVSRVRFPETRSGSHSGSKLNSVSLIVIVSKL